MSGLIVYDVTGDNKDCFYVIFPNKEQIYKIKTKDELRLVKNLQPSRRWFGGELQELLDRGYRIIDKLVDFDDE